MSRFNPDDDLGRFEGTLSKKARKNRERKISVYEKLDGHCAYCGKSISLNRMEIDHIINRADFFKLVVWGEIPDFLRHLHEDHPNHIDNLFPSCGKCNGMKGTLTLEGFRTKLKNKSNRSLSFKNNWSLPIVFYFEKQKDGE